MKKKTDQQSQHNECEKRQKQEEQLKTQNNKRKTHTNATSHNT